MHTLDQSHLVACTIIPEECPGVGASDFGRRRDVCVKTHIGEQRGEACNADDGLHGWTSSWEQLAATSRLGLFRGRGHRSSPSVVCPRVSCRLPVQYVDICHTSCMSDVLPYTVEYGVPP